MKNESSKGVYERRLTVFLRWVGLTADDIVNKARKEPSTVQDLTTMYMFLQKDCRRTASGRDRSP
ncbi:MAG: hypothetical protein ACLQEQ_04330 [Nitrososphaerales archaeon]